MTALKKYQKLESSGLWRDTPEAQRREVVVNFGDASLMLSDPRSEVVLSHWSLPAVERLNPGALPALYAPGADTAESLELDDPEMIAALEAVRVALAHARPRPGRLRGVILATGTALVVGLGVFWGPGALIDHTISVVPPTTRLQIGRMALADLERVTGQPCAGTLGKRALDTLAARLFGTPAPHLFVLREAGPAALHLPGRIILLNRSLFEAQDGPEAAAGHALAEAAHADAEDPLLPLLRYVGLRATFGLLTRGTLDEDAIAGYGEATLRRPAVPPPNAALLARFQTAEVPSTAYAYSIDPSGETVLGLIEADPFRTGKTRTLLSDGDWISLQGICTE